MRAVLDPNVIVSALLSRSGSPARLVRAWLDGAFELVVTPALLVELGRALNYRKIRARIAAEDAAALIGQLRVSATVVPDAEAPPEHHSRDPRDDYLLSVAAREHAALVSGDRHVLELAGSLPVYSPTRFLELLTTEEPE